MIIDAHMHVGNFPAFDVHLEPGELAAHLAASGIDAGLVFSPDNELARQVVHEVPAAFGLYWANPKDPAAVKEAATALDDPRFRGIKLHPLLDGFHPDDPLVWPLIELAIERDLPVLIHSGHAIFSEPWLIEQLIWRYQQAKIILGHMGHGNIVHIDEAIAIARRHPNVYLETSGMPMHTKIRTAVRRAGGNRVMYGSDSPFHSPAAEQLKVREAGLDEAELHEVMCGTACQLFFARLPGVLS